MNLKTQRTEGPFVVFYNISFLSQRSYFRLRLGDLLLGLHSDPEDGDCMFLRNVARRYN